MLDGLKAIPRRYPVFILLGLLLLMAAVVTPQILSPENILTAIRQYSVVGIMALGVTFVVIAGRVDVSIGSLMSVLVVVVISLHDKVGAELAMLAGIGVGLVVGATNGFLVAYVRLNSLIVTLGMMTALQGVAQVATAGILNQVADPEGSWFKVIGRSFLFGVPVSVWIFAGLALICGLVLRRTHFGRSVRAVGGNETGSIYSSINSRATIFVTFLIASFLTAIAAIVFASYAMAAPHNSGSGLEMTVLASIFLGGTSIGGGVGGMGRTVIGIVVLALLNNGMILVGMPIQAQWLISCFIIITAVMLDTYSRRGTIFA
ncbi:MULTISPECIES: ABC transporter permease [unclassified Mesorhizobium]|uniref:ABC transporter permease n=1 Tax=unclassified Mesorhizobium TaxID=325217 RepID=UPI000FDA87EB|nr:MULTISPECIES: ABC transporter permease [unclassified Mesorhizobium]TGR23012.1 ABC transporter permease [Mesorhizobium sp. M8A.F.Ca.ET.197.01.1.1]TGR39097.1 ABC transporter permease [bacterium M00.F.Ca.ET.199.01.1.1]TGR46691.1 ABC transporter permease [Mesorhizobium sp. M8A.F.Ca.ET.198.01.1.1]TGV85235.1 ABC transporter permease [Mesorhizobium sp. M00.F.Ca.ET.149.01.1.1]